MSGQASPVGRVAIEVKGVSRILAWIIMFGTLGFGGWIAYKNYSGVGTAAIFAVAIIFAIVAIGGTLPASIKVGDVSIALQQAHDDGMKEGVSAGIQNAHDVAMGIKSPADAASAVALTASMNSSDIGEIAGALERIQDVAASHDPDDERARLLAVLDKRSQHKA
ncbi:MAG: hypothetical protein ACXVHL_34345 [Solirubrobacteraceae bacterium]